MTVEKQDLLELTTEIVAAFVGKNILPADQLPDLIQGVHRSLAGVEAMGNELPLERPKPAVPMPSPLSNNSAIAGSSTRTRNATVVSYLNLHRCGSDSS